LVPVAIFGFVDTMYLAQEKAYRELYGCIVDKVQGKTYGLGDTFKADADRTLGHVFAALASSIWPVYGGLIIAYIVAAQRGWLELLAATKL
jgi:hypothetical protein